MLAPFSPPCFAPYSLAMNYELVKYRRTRGSLYKVDDGFLYMKNKVTSTGAYLVCALKRSPEFACPATAKYKSAEDAVEAQKSHNHDAGAYEDDVSTFKVSLNLAAADPRDQRSARQKFDSLCAANPRAGR